MGRVKNIPLQTFILFKGAQHYYFKLVFLACPSFMRMVNSPLNLSGFGMKHLRINIEKWCKFKENTICVIYDVGFVIVQPGD